MKKTNKKPKKCKCGGTFVPPSDLGLDGEGYLICDNQDKGDGEPCVEWIPDEA